jgi:hypothetical protein
MLEYHGDSQGGALLRTRADNPAPFARLAEKPGVEGIYPVEVINKRRIFKWR